MGGLANNGDSLQSVRFAPSQLNHLVFEYPPGALRSLLYADFRDRGKGITPSAAKSNLFFPDGAVAPAISVVQTLFGQLDQIQAAIVGDSYGECKRFF